LKKDNGILNYLSACSRHILSQTDTALKSRVEKPARFQPVVGWFT